MTCIAIKNNRHLWPTLWLLLLHNRFGPGNLDPGGLLLHPHLSPLLGNHCLGQLQVVHSVHVWNNNNVRTW